MQYYFSWLLGTLSTVQLVHGQSCLAPMNYWFAGTDYKGQYTYSYLYTTVNCERVSKYDKKYERMI